MHTVGFCFVFLLFIQQSQWRCIALLPNTHTWSCLIVDTWACLLQIVWECWKATLLLRIYETNNKFCINEYGKHAAPCDVFKRWTSDCLSVHVYVLKMKLCSSGDGQVSWRSKSLHQGLLWKRGVRLVQPPGTKVRCFIMQRVYSRCFSFFVSTHM